MHANRTEYQSQMTRRRHMCRQTLSVMENVKCKMRRNEIASPGKRVQIGFPEHRIMCKSPTCTRMVRYQDILVGLRLRSVTMTFFEQNRKLQYFCHGGNRSSADHSSNHSSTRLTVQRNMVGCKPSNTNQRQLSS